MKVLTILVLESVNSSRCVGRRRSRRFFEGMEIFSVHPVGVTPGFRRVDWRGIVSIQTVEDEELVGGIRSGLAGSRWESLESGGWLACNDVGRESTGEICEVRSLSVSGIERVGDRKDTLREEVFQRDEQSQTRSNT